MRINKNNNDFTLILSEKAGQPTLPSSILTTTGDKGEDHGRKGINQQKKEKKRKRDGRKTGTTMEGVAIKNTAKEGNAKNKIRNGKYEDHKQLQKFGWK